MTSVFFFLVFLIHKHKIQKPCSLKPKHNGILINIIAEILIVRCYFVGFSLENPVYSESASLLIIPPLIPLLYF